MKDLAIQKPLLQELELNSPQAKNYIGLRSLFSKYHNKLNVPFYDDCCPTANESIPVRYFEGDIQFFNTDTNSWDVITSSGGLRFGVSGEDDTGAESRLFTTDFDFSIFTNSSDGGNDITFRNDFLLNGQYAQVRLQSTNVTFEVNETGGATPGIFGFNELSTSFFTNSFFVGKTDAASPYIYVDNNAETYTFGPIGFNGDYHLSIYSAADNITLGTTAYPAVLLDYANNIFILGDALGSGNASRVRVSDFDSDISFNSQSITISQGLQEYADDAAAAGGGLQVGMLYRTGSIVKIRVS